MAEVVKWGHLDVINTSNSGENWLSIPCTCRVPVKFKMMLAQAKLPENWPWNLNEHIWKGNISIKYERESCWCGKYLRTVNAAMGWCPLHIAIYLAWCPVYIRASFNFTMTLDSATGLEDVPSVISEKWKQLPCYLRCS